MDESAPKTNILTAAEIIKIRSNYSQVLPITGSKEFAPSGSWLETKQIRCALDERKTMLEEKKVDKITHLSKAEWRPDRNRALVTTRIGGHYEVMGTEEGNNLWLRAEEILLLLEMNQVELWFGAVPMSVEQGYNVLLAPGTGCTMDEYSVYKHLNHLGYRVVRHQEVTQYELDIRLNQYTDRRCKSIKEAHSGLAAGRRSSSDVVVNEQDVIHVASMPSVFMEEDPLVDDEPMITETTDIIDEVNSESLERNICDKQVDGDNARETTSSSENVAVLEVTQTEVPSKTAEEIPTENVQSTEAISGLEGDTPKFGEVDINADSVETISVDQAPLKEVSESIPTAMEMSTWTSVNVASDNLFGDDAVLEEWEGVEKEKEVEPVVVDEDSSSPPALLLKDDDDEEIIGVTLDNECKEKGNSVVDAVDENNDEISVMLDDEDDLEPMITSPPSKIIPAVKVPERVVNKIEQIDLEDDSDSENNSTPFVSVQNKVEVSSVQVVEKLDEDILSADSDNLPPEKPIPIKLADHVLDPDVSVTLPIPLSENITSVALSENDSIVAVESVTLSQSNLDVGLNSVLDKIDPTKIQSVENAYVVQTSTVDFVAVGSTLLKEPEIFEKVATNMKKSDVNSEDQKVVLQEDSMLEKSKSFPDAEGQMSEIVSLDHSNLLGIEAKPTDVTNLEKSPIKMLLVENRDSVQEKTIEVVSMDVCDSVCKDNIIVVEENTAVTVTSQKSPVAASSVDTTAVSEVVKSPTVLSVLSSSNIETSPGVSVSDQDTVVGVNDLLKSPAETGEAATSPMIKVYVMHQSRKPIIASTESAETAEAVSDKVLAEKHSVSEPDKVLHSNVTILSELSKEIPLNSLQPSKEQTEGKSRDEFIDYSKLKTDFKLVIGKNKCPVLVDIDDASFDKKLKDVFSDKTVGGKRLTDDTISSLTNKKPRLANLDLKEMNESEITETVEDIADQDMETNAASFTEQGGIDSRDFLEGLELNTSEIDLNVQGNCDLLASPSVELSFDKSVDLDKTIDVRPAQTDASVSVVIQDSSSPSKTIAVEEDAILEVNLSVADEGSNFDSDCIDLDVEESLDGDDSEMEVASVDSDVELVDLDSDSDIEVVEVDSSKRKRTGVDVDELPAAKRQAVVEVVNLSDEESTEDEEEEEESSSEEDSEVEVEERVPRIKHWTESLKKDTKRMEILKSIPNVVNKFQMNLSIPENVIPPGCRPLLSKTVRLFGLSAVGVGGKPSSDYKPAHQVYEAMANQQIKNEYGSQYISVLPPIQSLPMEFQQAHNAVLQQNPHMANLFPNPPPFGNYNNPHPPGMNGFGPMHPFGHQQNRFGSFPPNFSPFPNPMNGFGPMHPPPFAQPPDVYGNFPPNFNLVPNPIHEAPIFRPITRPRMQNRTLSGVNPVPKPKPVPGPYRPHGWFQQNNWYNSPNPRQVELCRPQPIDSKQNIVLVKTENVSNVTSNLVQTHIRWDAQNVCKVERNSVQSSITSSPQIQTQVVVSNTSSTLTTCKVERNTDEYLTIPPPLLQSQDNTAGLVGRPFVCKTEVGGIDFTPVTMDRFRTQLGATLAKIQDVKPNINDLNAGNKSAQQHKDAFGNIVTRTISRQAAARKRRRERRKQNLAVLQNPDSVTVMVKEENAPRVVRFDSLPTETIAVFRKAAEEKTKDIQQKVTNCISSYSKPTPLVTLEEIRQQKEREKEEAQENNLSTPKVRFDSTTIETLKRIATEKETNPQSASSHEENQVADLAITSEPELSNTQSEVDKPLEPVTEATVSLPTLSIKEIRRRANDRSQKLLLSLKKKTSIAQRYLQPSSKLQLVLAKVKQSFQENIGNSVVEDEEPKSDEDDIQVDDEVNEAASEDGSVNISEAEEPEEENESLIDVEDDLDVGRIGTDSNSSVVREVHDVSDSSREAEDGDDAEHAINVGSSVEEQVSRDGDTTGDGSIEVDEGEVEPLLRPSDCTDLGSVLSRLAIIKRATVASATPLPERTRKISFDLYNPSSGKSCPKFRKSCPGTPDYRVVVLSVEDSVPDANELSAVQRLSTDDVPLLFAVVHYGSVSFVRIGSVELPVDLTDYASTLTTVSHLKPCSE